MAGTYAWLKLAHVVAVIVWLGGSVALSVLNASLLKGRDRAVLSAFSREAGFYGPMIVGPASLLTLITGLAMAFMTRAFGALWVQIGFGGIVLHFILGAGLIRATAIRVQSLIGDPQSDATQLAAAARRLRGLNVIYLLMLFVVVAVMVLKPL